jgi:DNA repair exonuclease SbcCD nuclease subunit
MQRKYNKNKLYKKVDAILCSDFHLRETVPVCRKDDFWSEQWRKVDFISDLQKQYNCPVLHGGDLYDHWKPSPNLLRETMIHLPKQFHTCYGQHDLPQHNIELADKCGINALEQAKSIGVPEMLLELDFSRIIEFCNWNETPQINKKYNGDLQMIYCLVWHKMNYKGKEPWPGCTDPTALNLLKKYPEYSLILTGDNHKSFVQEYEGRLLVNPGSLMRMDADQVEHKPRVYLWYAETNTVEVVYIPIKNNVISREHLNIVELRNKRIDAYVSRLNNKWEVTMSYEKNLEVFEKENNVDKSTMDIIYRSLEV